MCGAAFFGLLKSACGFAPKRASPAPIAKVKKYTLMLGEEPFRLGEPPSLSQGKEFSNGAGIA